MEPKISTSAKCEHVHPQRLNSNRNSHNINAINIQKLKHHRFNGVIFVKTSQTQTYIHTLWLDYQPTQTHSDFMRTAANPPDADGKFYMLYPDVVACPLLILGEDRCERAC